jgi:hypothetical protein
MTMLNTADQMQTLLGKIARASMSLRARTQEYLIHAAGHAYEHGDVTYFVKLVKAAKGADAKKITAWGAEYGFTQINKDGSAKLIKIARKEADFADGAAVVEYLSINADNWWEVGAKVKAPATLDVNKKVQAIITALTTAIAEDEVARVDVAQLREEMLDLIRMSELLDEANRQRAAAAAAEAPVASNVVAIAAE